MATATLTLPDDVKEELKRFSWINWSEVARESFMEKIKQAKKWDELEKILSKSQLTEEDAFKLADEMKKSLAKRYMKLLKEKK